MHDIVHAVASSRYRQLIFGVTSAKIRHIMLKELTHILNKMILSRDDDK